MRLRKGIINTVTTGGCAVATAPSCEWSRDARQNVLARLYYDLKIMDSERHLACDPEFVEERKGLREKTEAFLDCSAGS